MDDLDTDFFERDKRWNTDQQVDGASLTPKRDSTWVQGHKSPAPSPGTQRWNSTKPTPDKNQRASRSISANNMEEGVDVAPCVDEEVTQAFEQVLNYRLEEKRRMDEVKRKFQNQKGILNKQGQLVKSWKTRFFEIKGDNLIYYQTDLNFVSSKKGQFSLKDCNVEEHPSIEGYDFCFVVKTSGGRDYLLSAPSKDSMQDWVDAIRFVGKGEIPNYDFDHLSQTYFASSSKLKGERLYKCGWLERQGDGIRRIYKNNFFVLNSGRLTNSIPYYETQGDKIKVGEIPLKDSIVQKIEVKGKSNGFVVYTRGVDKQQVKAFILCAKTAKDCDEWIEAIKQAILALADEQNYIDLFFADSQEK